MGAGIRRGIPRPSNGACTDWPGLGLGHCVASGLGVWGAGSWEALSAVGGSGAVVLLVGGAWVADRRVVSAHGRAANGAPGGA